MVLIDLSYGMGILSSQLHAHQAYFTLAFPPRKEQQNIKFPLVTRKLLTPELRQCLKVRVRVRDL